MIEKTVKELLQEAVTEMIREIENDECSYSLSSSISGDTQVTITTTISAGGMDESVQ